MRVLDPILLQCSQIIDETQIRPNAFEDAPVLFGSLRSDFRYEVRSQVTHNAIVVQQCVVHIE